MKRNGGSVEPVLETEVNEQSASWSPQDKRIAHTHEHQLSVAPVDGSGGSQHLFEEDNTDYSVDWGSPVTCPDPPEPSQGEWLDPGSPIRQPGRFDYPL